MEIKDWTSTGSRSALYRELKELDLFENIAELDGFGYTIIPPEKVGPPEQHEAVKNAILRIAAKRKGCAPDELPQYFAGMQDNMRFVLWDDPIFEKIVLTPAALGLIQWLVGTDCILSLLDGWVKGKGAAGSDIHADWGQFDMPTMPPEPFGANFNYVLSDYTKEDGALSFVPGSHRWRRWPSNEEAAYWKDKAEVAEAPAGSMIVWGDHLWHGSYPKQTDGLRVMLLGMYCRPHMQTQEGFRETATDEALARNPVRFARLMNVYHPMPMGRSGKDMQRSGSAPRGYQSLFDTEPAGDKVSADTPRDFEGYDREAANATMKLLEEKAATGTTFPDLYHG
jgi:hypothetical protein